MRRNIHKSAFTLAELMVIMAVMTVVLAAIAPIFTSRYTNVSFDNVWANVGATKTNDIYNDAPIRSMMQQSIIGVTPVDMEDVRKTFQPYSKVIIRSTHKVDSDKKQKQIEFKYNESTKGYFFSANYNQLLGGSYDNIKFNYIEPDLGNITQVVPDLSGAAGNTALGTNALNSLTTGQYNTAFGYHSLEKVTTGNYNTALGAYSGHSLTTGSGNVFIGYNSYNASEGDYNTIISNNEISKSDVSNYTTAVGNNINVKGDYNVALGDSTNAGGKYNTAVGYGALLSANPDTDTYSNFQFNTAIGYNSCSGMGATSKYLTCIGGVGVDALNMNSTAQGFFDDDAVRVLIGPAVSAYGSAATLEVYMSNSNHSNSPFNGLADTSVIVNGNLIVRGQTYMIGRSPFPMQPNVSPGTYAGTVSLMGYKLYKESTNAHKPLIGLDGSEQTVKLKDDSGFMHEKYAGREHCICNYSCSASKDYMTNGYSGRDSYDWSYLSFNSYDYVFDSSFGGYNYFWGHHNHKCGSDYNDNIHGANNIELDRAHNLTDGGSGSGASQLVSGGSCCPILTNSGIRRTDSLGVTSDERLKNIYSKFTNGLNSITRLNVYNYTFKNDSSKIPYTGVIAQDLRKVFPSSVSKDKNGYYKIRWDEMFYAAINSVKELNEKIVNLTQRIEKDLKRISELLNENKKLEKRILELSNEIDSLE